jgi:hypothetical protein
MTVQNETVQKYLTNFQLFRIKATTVWIKLLNQKEIKTVVTFKLSGKKKPVWYYKIPYYIF